MTLMSFFLLIILLLAFFIYFSSLNPGDMTIFYWGGESITTSVTYVVISVFLAGLLVGVLAYFYSGLLHLVRNWRRERREKKAREVFAVYRDGVARLLSGDLKRARVLLRKALDKDPRRIDTLIAMASLAIQEAQPHEGVSWLLKAREIEANSLEVLFKLATTYEEMGRDGDAEAIYREILVVDKQNRKARRGVRDLAMKDGRWRDALELQKELVRMVQGGPRQGEEMKRLQHIKYEVASMDLAAGNMDQAKSEFSEIIKQDPEFVPARVSLGDICWRQRRTEEAARIWQEGYRRLHKGIFLERLEDLYIAAEDPGTLLGFYRSAMAADQGDSLLRLYYAKLCLRLEMVDEAGEHVFALEGAGVEHPLVHFLAAEVYRRRQRIDEALEEYRRAIGMDHRLQVTYDCEACGASHESWQSRCSACGAWGSLSLAGRKELVTLTPVTLREIRHGER